MFIKSLSYIGKYTLTSKNLIIVLNQGYNRTKMSSVKTVVDGWNDVKNRMDKVVQKLNRSGPEPRLVAVSKTKSVEQIVAVFQLGQRHFGENYIQEMGIKALDHELLVKCPEIKWHFIGRLQRNKVLKLIVIPGLYMIESIDSFMLANSVNNGWAYIGKEDRLKVMIQVNTSNEKEKGGVSIEQLLDLFKHIYENCVNLELVGLMTIGRFGHDPSKGPNPDFLTLVECRKHVCDHLHLNASSIELSMGMSNDFEQAIELGSTSVRVGSSIFGSRPPKEKQ